jgi:hypothetical protein
VTAIAKEKLSAAARLHHSERGMLSIASEEIGKSPLIATAV